MIQWTAALSMMGTACGGPMDEHLDDPEIGQTASAQDPWYFCVDHPCANLEALYFNFCPVRRGIFDIGVRNSGNYSSWPTTTRLTLGSVHTVNNYSTPGLSPGAQWVVGVPVPQSWIDSCRNATSSGPCRWEVRADATDIQNEPNGGDNVVGGNCWGHFGDPWFRFQ